MAKRKPVILDLFCGTKSIAHAFEKEGFRTITLDNDDSFKPDITTDIKKWRGYRDMHNIDVIWASPPCQGFSVAAIGKNWKKGSTKPQTQTAKEALEMVKKTQKIIDTVKPRYWFIENPRAMLRKMPIMEDKPRKTVTYCQYGDTRMKPTDIWGTLPPYFKAKKCKSGDPCHEKAPRGSRKGTQGMKDAKERARIPPRLGASLAKAIKKDMECERKCGRSGKTAMAEGCVCNWRENT